MGRGQLTITRFRIIIITARVVTLTHRSHITTAIDEPTHVAVVDCNFGVAIDLTGRPAMNIFYKILRSIIGIFLVMTLVVSIPQCRFEGASTLTATEDRTVNRTAMDSDLGILHDVSVLTAAIDGTDSGLRMVFLIFRADNDLGLTHIGTETFDVALFMNISDIHKVISIFFLEGHLSLTSTEHIASIVVPGGATDMTTRDINSRLTTYVRRFRIRWNILKFIWPAQSKTISLLFGSSALYVIVLC